MKLQLDQTNPLQSPSRAAAFLKSRRRPLAALALLIAIAVLIVAWTVKRRAEREFEVARMLLEERSLAPFEKDARRAFAGAGVRLIQSSRAIRGLARFNGSVFATTDGGLVEFGEDGNRIPWRRSSMQRQRRDFPALVIYKDIWQEIWGHAQFKSYSTRSGGLEASRKSFVLPTCRLR
jgi:hypothetical protein